MFYYCVLISPMWFSSDTPDSIGTKDIPLFACFDNLPVAGPNAASAN